MSEGALKGVRILDLTQVAVGPYGTMLLGMMGAEVLKVESCTRADVGRGPVKPLPNQYRLYPGNEPGERPWNRHAHYTQRNRNKLSITMDVAKPEGKALFKKLVAKCDAVIENFRAAVVDRWGLNYEVLKEINPGLVYLKLSSQGNSGPERDYGSLGNTVECTGGMASITGYNGGPAMMTHETYPDPVVGILSVGAVLSGLRYRRKTGQGVFIDLSQREVTTCLIGEAIMDYSMNQHIQQPIGNRHLSSAPQGVYPCLGEDNWVAITVSTEEEWAGLGRALGSPAWSQDPRFATAAGRWEHHEEIDCHISAWTKERDHQQAMHLLQAHGVPAGAVLKGSEIIKDPHLEARNWWDRTLNPEVGRVYSFVAAPWTLSKSPRVDGMPAPALGQHNHYVYGEILGLSEAEIAELEAKEIIGTDAKWE